MFIPPGGRLFSFKQFLIMLERKAFLLLHLCVLLFYSLFMLVLFVFGSKCRIMFEAALKHTSITQLNLNTFFFDDFGPWESIFSLFSSLSSFFFCLLFLRIKKLIRCYWRLCFMSNRSLKDWKRKGEREREGETDRNREKNVSIFVIFREKNYNSLTVRMFLFYVDFF